MKKQKQKHIKSDNTPQQIQKEGQLKELIADKAKLKTTKAKQVLKNTNNKNKARTQKQQVSSKVQTLSKSKQIACVYKTPILTNHSKQVKSPANDTTSSRSANKSVKIPPYAQQHIYSSYKMVVDESHIQHFNNSQVMSNINLEQQLESLSEKKQQITKQMDYTKIGRTVKSALLKAQAESRVIVGLSAAIQVLSKSPEGSLFCLMAVPQVGDSATHMHEVLLEAFCYENDIYVIKVDCPTKLSRILGKTVLESCCLVQKSWTGADESGEEQLNKQEEQLVDYCEAYWDAPQHPIVELPVVWMCGRTVSNIF